MAILSLAGGAAGHPEQRAPHPHPRLYDGSHRGHAPSNTSTNPNPNPNPNPSPDTNSLQPNPSPAPHQVAIRRTRALAYYATGTDPAEEEIAGELQLSSTKVR